MNSCADSLCVYLPVPELLSVHNRCTALLHITHLASAADHTALTDTLLTYTALYKLLLFLLHKSIQVFVDLQHSAVIIIEHRTPCSSTFNLYRLKLQRFQYTPKLSFCDVIVVSQLGSCVPHLSHEEKHMDHKPDEENYLDCTDHTL